MSVTIESDLKDILNKIDAKLDTLSRDVAEIRQKDLDKLPRL